MIGAYMDARQFLQVMKSEIDRLDPDAIERLAQAVYSRYLAGRFVFVVGNGGSGANASHLCEDLGKGTALPEEGTKRLKILSLTDNTPYILAWGNDTSFDRIFVEQLRNLAEPGDLLIAISGSGNSPNVLRAVEWANANGIETFGVTGFQGGKLRNLARQSFHCAVDDMGLVETLHLLGFHYVVDRVYALVMQHNGRMLKAG